MFILWRIIRCGGNRTIWMVNDLYRDKYSDQVVFDGKRAPYEKMVISNFIVW